mmetsp:Transcript_40846/g.98079  ORF Transcript_40846/g.98079 Transcript_40846/m.98079 type:complete len:508 (+) Transcript_40846:11-1534(+)
MCDAFRFRSVALPTARVTDVATASWQTPQRRAPPQDIFPDSSRIGQQPWSWLKPPAAVEHAVPSVSDLTDIDSRPLFGADQDLAGPEDWHMISTAACPDFRVSQSQTVSSDRTHLSRGALRSSSYMAEDKHLQASASARRALGAHTASDHSQTVDILVSLPARLEEVQKTMALQRQLEERRQKEQQAQQAQQSLVPSPLPCQHEQLPLSPASSGTESAPAPDRPQNTAPSALSSQTSCGDSAAVVLRHAELEATRWSDGQPRQHLASIRQAVTKAVGQISLVEDALQRVANLLAARMTALPPAAGESCFVQALIARRLVEQCDVQVRKQPAFCWAVARVAAQCCERCPDFRLPLEATFRSNWPITAPDLDAAAATPREAEQHVAAARVWAAYLVWSGQMDRLWSWVAGVANQVPRGPAVVALHAVLCETAWFLKQTFGRQLDKFLQVMESSYVAAAGRIEQGGAQALCAGSTARLAVWLKCVARDGVSRPESSERLQLAQTPISQHT